MAQHSLRTDLLLIWTVTPVIIVLGSYLLRRRSEAALKRWGMSLAFGTLLIADLISSQVFARPTMVFCTVACLVAVLGVVPGSRNQCSSCEEFLPIALRAPVRFCPYCGARVESAPGKEKGPPPDLLE